MGRVRVGLMAVALMAACSSEQAEGTGSEGRGSEDQLRTTPTPRGGQTSFSNQTVLWEGDSKYLMLCDPYSKNGVQFTCNESPDVALVDDGFWIALPKDVFVRGRHCNRKA